jgi:hypothetical protein
LSKEQCCPAQRKAKALGSIGAMTRDWHLYIQTILGIFFPPRQAKMIFV